MKTQSILTASLVTIAIGIGSYSATGLAAHSGLASPDSMHGSKTDSAVHTPTDDVDEDWSTPAWLGGLAGAPT